MSVFMAGKRYVGVDGSKARRTEVLVRISLEYEVRAKMRILLTGRLSHIPPAIFAKVFAEQGATRTISAQRRSCPRKLTSSHLP